MKVKIHAQLGLTLFILLSFACGIISTSSPPLSSTNNTSTSESTSPALTAPSTLLENHAVNPNSPLGINLNAVVDYTDEDPFLDYMKTSREWFGQNDSQFDTMESDKIDLDENGWVRTLKPLDNSASFTRVATIMMTSADLHNNYQGDYAVLYEGRGKLGYDGASIISSAPGRDLIHVNATEGYLQLQILETDEGDYLRNIQVVKKEYEKLLLHGEIFNPIWLAKLQPFRSIRFMDWMNTNGGIQSDFSTRPVPKSARYTTPKGVPAEVMTALANQLQAEPWFNMPTQATDDYIASFAELVKNLLDPNLNLYVEYSNEVWNTGYPFHPQGSYIDQQAEAEFGPPESIVGGFYTARMNWHGKRTAEICQLWKNVFGDQASRITCVLGAQAANLFTADEALNCPLWQNDPQNQQPGTPCQSYGIDAVAIAPYFGSYIGDPSWQAQVKTFSVDQVFGEIFSGGIIKDPAPGDFNDPFLQGALEESINFMQDYKIHAAENGYRLLAYEGGQHLAGVNEVMNDELITNTFTAANRDPRMGQAYTQYLQAWKENGGETFMLYSFAARYGQFGSWGLLEFLEQAGSPKYQAVTKFTQSNPCWWQSCTIEQK